jgi:hypothetical protein
MNTKLPFGFWPLLPLSHVHTHTLSLTHTFCFLFSRLRALVNCWLRRHRARHCAGEGGWRPLRDHGCHPPRHPRGYIYFGVSEIARAAARATCGLEHARRPNRAAQMSAHRGVRTSSSHENSRVCRGHHSGQQRRHTIAHTANRLTRTRRSWSITDCVRFSPDFRLGDTSS